MENLTGLSEASLIFLLSLSLFAFLAHSQVLLFLRALRLYLIKGYPAISAGTLLSLGTIFLTFAWAHSLLREGFFFTGAAWLIRYGVGLLNLLILSYWIRKDRRPTEIPTYWGLSVLANIAILPLWDHFMPVNLLVALLFFAVRTSLLAWKIWGDRSGRLGPYAIQEAVNVLPEGIWIFDSAGRDILLNEAMLNWMKISLPAPCRNPDLFWQMLQKLPGCILLPENSCKWKREDGKFFLISRKTIQGGRISGYQILISDVTELERFNAELAEKSRFLETQNREIKTLLNRLEVVQRKNTIQEVTGRIHDLMGQRISVLQQVLNAGRIVNYKSIIPLLDNVIEDMRGELAVEPASLLKEMIEMYRQLGIQISVTGRLPFKEDRAHACVQIIREALNNAVRHGYASEVRINFARRRNGGWLMNIADNGVGAPQGCVPGIGLRAIANRAAALRGKASWVTNPHFTLRIELGE